MLRWVFLFSFFCRGFSAIAQQDFFEQALAHIQQGSLQEAFPLLLKAAESGIEPQATFFLSQAYRTGTGTSPNDSLADVWLLKSASQGYAPALGSAATLMLNPRSHFYDTLSGYRILRICAAQHQADCQLNLARHFLYRQHKKGNLDSALVILKNLAANRNLSEPQEIACKEEALEKIFDLYSWPNSKVFNEHTALVWFLVWTAQMQESTKGSKEMLMKKGKELYLKFPEAKANKALKMAEDILQEKISLPDGFKKKKKETKA